MDSPILTPADLPSNPMAAYRAWLAEARDADLVDPDAAVVATVGADGAPSARPVLIRIIDDEGVVFFTNRESRKGRELALNANVAVTAVWTSLHRCVRIEGTATAASDEESDAYWAGRPHGSRIAALASPQSRQVERSALEAEVERLTRLYPEGSTVPRPAHWGGVRVTPTTVEFWAGRRHRLHDRIVFTRAGSEWTTTRLAP